MKKDERAKIITTVLDIIRDELPRLVAEEFKAMIWNEISEEVHKIESELDIIVSGYGFIPLASRLRRIHFEIKSRRRRL